MHIIILGAGRIGQFVAHSLSLDGHSVVLVDMNREKLEEASLKMDVAIKRGIGTDWKLLDELMEEAPELLLALTEDDEVNLVACTIAKSLGKIRTIARVKDSRYLRHDHYDVGHLFHVDHLVVPELLVAEQISKISMNQGLYSESFFHGGILLRTATIPTGWEYAGKTLNELHTSEKKLLIAIIGRKKEGLATTEKEIIFPHGQDILYPGDEVTLIGDANLPYEMHSFLGTESHLPQSVLIAGGSLVGSELARELHSKAISIRLAETSIERCHKLAEELPDIAVLHYLTIDWEFLKSERVDQADVFVACSSSEEKNLQLALFAKEIGCKKVIAVLADPATSRLADKFGILHVVSPRIITTDRILTLIRAEKVTSIVSLYDQRAEIMEVKVSLDSPLVGIPLSLLGPRLPPELLIAAICSRGRLFIASGTHILSPDDEVIVICHPKHRTYLEQIF